MVGLTKRWFVFNNPKSVCVLTSYVRGLRAEECADFIFEEIGASVLLKRLLLLLATISPTILLICIVEGRIPLVYPSPVCSCLSNLS